MSYSHFPAGPYRGRRWYRHWFRQRRRNLERGIHPRVGKPVHSPDPHRLVAQGVQQSEVQLCEYIVDTREREDLQLC